MQPLDGTFDGEQLRYGMHAELTDVELADMNGDGSLDAVGPTNPTGTTAGALIFVRIAPTSTQVSAWGDNTYGQGNVPSGLGSAVAIAAVTDSSEAFTKLPSAFFTSPYDILFWIA